MALDGSTTTFLPYTLNGLQEIAADSQVVQTLQVNSLTPNRVVVSDSGDYLVSAGASTTEVDYLIGTTSNIQSQLNSKASTSYVNTNFLNKTTSSDQTVAGKVTFSSDLVVADEKVANLASKVVVDANYQNLITSANVSISQNFGTITNALGVYQSTTNTSAGTPILIFFPITNAKRYRFTVEVLVEDTSATWYVSPYQSVDNVNPVTYGTLSASIISPSTTLYTLIDLSFQAVTTGNVVVSVESDLGAGNDKAFKWKNLTVYEEGVALTNVSMPAQLGDRVVVLNEKKQLIASGISTTKLGYLDNVSSDIQTQLNGKATLAGGNTFTGTQNYSDQTASRVSIFDASKNLVSSTISTTTLGYLDNVSSDIQTQLNGKLSTSGGTITGDLTVSGAVNVGNRLLGRPDNTPSGNFWIGLQGSGTETQRLALSLQGNYTTGEVSSVSISRPLNLDTNKITTSYVPSNGVDVTNKTYVDGAISGAGSLYVLKAGDTMTGTLTVSSGTNRGVISYSNNFNSYLSCRVDTNASLGLELAMERTSNTGYLIQREDADLAFRTNNVERMRMSKTGEITIFNPFITNLTSPTIPFQTFITTQNHYNGNPSTTYLMSGLSGYLTLAKDTTRNNTDACLMWGTNASLSEVTSVKTDGSGLMPLNFGGSSFLFTGGAMTVNDSLTSRNHFIGSGYYLNCGNGNYGTDEANRTQIAFGYFGETTGYRHRITSEHNGSDGVSGNGNSLNFYLWSASDAVGAMGTNHRMTIAGGGVGIKTLNPSAPLHVTASGNANPGSNGIYVLNTSNSANQDAIVSIRVAGSLAGDAFTSYDILGEAGWSTGIRNTDNAYVINQGWDNIRNQERFVINSSGNCGIGHSPTYKLDVNGGIRAYGNATGGPSIIMSENANSGDAYAILHVRNNTGTGCYWFLNSNTRTDDGGANTATLRNDVGTLRLQANSAVAGIQIWKNTQAVNIYGGGTFAVPTGFMAAGSLTIGATDKNYGGATNGWTSNTAGLLLECSDYTEMAVHDAGTRLASFMYYNGPANVFIIGRDMGNGTTQVLIPNQLVVGTKISIGNSHNGNLNIQNPNNSYTHFGYFDNVNYIRNKTIFDTGYVEIGSSYVWRAPLDITTAVGRDNGCVRYFDVYGGLGYTCNWYSYSAMADTWGGSRFMAYSDVRKKKNIKTVSTAIKDIQGLRIVSYDHIDHVQPHNYWGVIAQEIEEQYPYLISQGKEFLPNIFVEALAHQCSKCGDFVWLEMTVLVDPNHVGKLVKIITYDEEGKTEYEETTTIVAVEDFRMKVKVWKKQDEVRYESKERVFVYGTCEEDVRTVDKTQFGLLAVAGVQEQQKIIEEQRKRIEVIEQRNKLLEQHARQLETDFNDYREQTDRRMTQLAELVRDLLNEKNPPKLSKQKSVIS